MTQLQNVEITLGARRNIPSNTTLLEAAMLLTASGEDSLVVTGDKREPVGLLAKHDVMLRLIRDWPQPARTTVARCMTQPVVTPRNGCTRRDVAELMHRHGANLVAVVNGRGELIGSIGMREMIWSLQGESGLGGVPGVTCDTVLAASPPRERTVSSG